MIARRSPRQPRPRLSRHKRRALGRRSHEQLPSLFLRNRTVSGGTLLSAFARALSSSGVGRLVEDRTGLAGYYALTLTFSGPSRPGADVPVDPGDAPSIFIALQEQLGLRLEPARKQVQAVVIDHIEPPTEN